jgi:hypothetical protein
MVLRLTILVKMIPKFVNLVVNLKSNGLIDVPAKAVQSASSDCCLHVMLEKRHDFLGNIGSFCFCA